MSFWFVLVETMFGFAVAFLTCDDMVLAEAAVVVRLFAEPLLYFFMVKRLVSSKEIVLVLIKRNKQILIK